MGDTQLDKQTGGLRDWHDLTPAEQLRLREDYGHYLDRLPPTCSMESKIARFAAWLAERGVEYRT